MTPPLYSIKKALRILQTFSVEQPELGVTEISIILKTPKSSVSRIISTLTSEGFLEKNPTSRKYRLGLKLVDLGHRVLGHYDIRTQARSFMEDLAEKTNEIVHLSILDKNEIIYLNKVGEGQVLTVATKIGGKHPAYACAMGKVLLSGLGPEILNEILGLGPLVKFTPKTITEFPKLLKELQRVKSQGFAIDNEESFSGIRCVAAPIYNRGGEVIAALSVTAPMQRMGQERMKEIKREVIETAQLISKRVGMNESITE